MKKKIKLYKMKTENKLKRDETKNKIIDRKAISKICAYMFSFLLVISILLSFFLNMMDITILSESYITSRLIESDYYNNTNKTIQSEFEQYTNQSGFDKSILENVFTQENITNDINGVIHSLYQNNKYEINTNIIEENLNRNIVKYIEVNNITLDLKQKSNIEAFKDVITASYVNNIFPKDIMDPIAETIQLLNSFITRLGSFIYALPYVIILCLILVNINRIVTTLKYASISVLSSGIFLTITYILLMKNINIGEISIFTKSISDILNLMFINIFNEISVFCIIFSSVGLALTLLFSIIEDKFDFEMLSNKGINANKWLYKY